MTLNPQSRGINLGHYRDYFIAKGMFYGAKMRALSRKFLAATSGEWNIIMTPDQVSCPCVLLVREDLHMPAITDPDEKDREGWAHIENAYMEFSRHSLPRSQRGLRP